MGWAAGFRAGTSMVDSVLAEQRARKQDERTATEFGWKEADRTRDVALRTKTDRLRDEGVALVDQGEGSEFTPGAPKLDSTGLPVPAAQALPAVSDAAQGQAGVRAGTAEGLSTKPVGAPQPAAPVSVGQAEQAAAGTATAPTPVEQATPAAKRKLGNAELIQQNLQKQALYKGDAAGYNVAKAGQRTAGFQNIVDTSVKEFMNLSPEKRDELANSPNLTNELPMVTLSTDKNGMMVVPVDPKTGRLIDPKNPIKLSWEDAAQLHAARRAGQEGFGAEAIELTNKVNEKLGKTIKDYNETMFKVQTGANDATYKGGQLEVSRGQLAEQRRHHGALEASEAAKVKIAQNKDLREKFSNGKYWTDPATGDTYLTVQGSKGLEGHKVSGDGSLAPVTKIPSGLKPAGSESWKALGSDGTITNGTTILAPNPNFGNQKMKGKSGVNVKDRYLDVTPGDSDFAKAVKADIAGKGGGAPAGPAAAPAAPAAGMVVPPAQQRPTAAAPPAAPAAPAAAAPAAPARDPVLAALNPGGNQQMDSLMAPKVSAVRDAAAQMAAIQQAMKQAVASGNQGYALQGSQAFAQAEARLNAVLQDMEPAAASRIRSAAMQQAGVQ